MELKLRVTAACASIARWFDNEAAATADAAKAGRHIDWLRVVPFIALHLGCIGVLWVGASFTAIAVAVLSQAGCHTAPALDGILVADAPTRSVTVRLDAR